MATKAKPTEMTASKELDNRSVTGADIFLGLSATAVTDILAQGKSRKFSPGSYIYEMRQSQDGVYFLKAGIVEEFRLTPEGQKLLMRRVGSGEFFGVASSSLGKYCCLAQAVAECDTAFLSFRQLESICRSYPAMVLNLLRWFAGRLGDVEQRFESIAFERLRVRVARALLNMVQSQGSQVINITQETLSTWVPASRPRINEVLLSLQQAGALQLYHRKIEVIDQDMLQREGSEATQFLSKRS